MKRILQLTALLALGLLIGAASAQTKPAAKPPVVAKVPTIPDALQAKFWKAQATLQSDAATSQQAQQKLQQSRTAFEAVIKEVQAACADFVPAMSPAGDPVCVAKVKK